MGMGDEPVGSPSTNGFSGVGPKSLMLKIYVSRKKVAFSRLIRTVYIYSLRYNHQQQEGRHE